MPLKIVNKMQKIYIFWFDTIFKPEVLQTPNGTQIKRLEVQILNM